jgi:hypothetical protein
MIAAQDLYVVSADGRPGTIRNLTAVKEAWIGEFTWPRGSHSISGGVGCHGLTFTLALARSLGAVELAIVDNDEPWAEKITPGFVPMCS